MEGTSRYTSGTALNRTDKEKRLDSLERMLQDEVSDTLFAQLKKLSIPAIRELHRLIQNRILSDSKGGE